jgi:hypothetical protein
VHFLVATSLRTQERVGTLLATWGQYVRHKTIVGDYEDPVTGVQKAYSGVPSDVAHDQSAREIFVPSLLGLYRSGEWRDVDWIVSVDDDTFVNVLEMRRLLSSLNPELPLLLCAFFSAGHCSGGPGMVYSREAFRRTMAAFDEGFCSVDMDYHDVRIPECALQQGVQSVQVHGMGRRGMFDTHEFPMLLTAVTLHFQRSNDMAYLAEPLGILIQNCNADVDTILDWT